MNQNSKNRSVRPKGKPSNNSAVTLNELRNSSYQGVIPQGSYLVVVYRGRNVPAEIGLTQQIPELSNAQDIQKVAGAGRFVLDQLEDPSEIPINVMDVMASYVDVETGIFDNYPALRSLALDTQLKVKALNDLSDALDVLEDKGNKDIKTNIHWLKLFDVILEGTMALLERWQASVQAMVKLPLEQFLAPYGVPKSIMNRVCSLRPQDLETIEPSNLLFKSDAKEWPKLFLNEVFNKAYIRAYLNFLAPLVEEEELCDIFSLSSERPAQILGLGHLADNHQDVVTRMSTDGILLVPKGLNVRNTLTPPGLPQMPNITELDELNAKSVRRVGLNVPLKSKFQDKQVVFQNALQGLPDRVRPILEAARLTPETAIEHENLNRILPLLVKEGVFREIDRKMQRVDNYVPKVGNQIDPEIIPNVVAALKERQRGPAENKSRDILRILLPEDELNRVNLKGAVDEQRQRLKALVKKLAEKPKKAPEKETPRTRRRGLLFYNPLSLEIKDMVGEICTYPKTRPFKDKIVEYLAGIQNSKLQFMAAKNMLGTLQVTQGVEVNTFTGSVDEDFQSDEDDSSDLF